MGEVFFLSEAPPLSPVDYSWFSESSTSEDPSHHTEENFNENILQHIDPVLGFSKIQERLLEAQETFSPRSEAQPEPSILGSPLPAPHSPEASEPKEALKSSQSHRAQGQKLEKEEICALKERLGVVEAQKADLVKERTEWLKEKQQMEALIAQLEGKNSVLKERRLEEELRHEIEMLRLNLQAERSRRHEEAEKISHYEVQLEAFEKSATHSSKNLEELVQDRIKLEQSLKADCDRRVQAAEKRQELLLTQKLKSEKEALAVILKERLQEEKNLELRETIATLSSKFEEDISRIRKDLAAQSKEEVEKIRIFYLEENTKLVSGSFELRQIIDQLEEAMEAKETQIKELRAKLKRTSLAALVSPHPEDRREMDAMKIQLELLQKRLLFQEEEKRRLLRQLELKASGYSSEISSHTLQLQALAQENRRLKERERQSSEALLREQNKLSTLEIKKLQASFEEEKRKLAEEFRRQKERDASFAQLRTREQIKGIMENVSLMKAEFAAHEQRLREQHAREKQHLTEQLLAAKRVEWKEAADLSWIASSFSTSQPSQTSKPRPIARTSEPLRSTWKERSVLSSGNLTPISQSSSPLLSPPIHPEDFARTESILKQERSSRNGRERFRVTFS